MEIGDTLKVYEWDRDRGVWLERDAGKDDVLAVMRFDNVRENVPLFGVMLKDTGSFYPRVYVLNGIGNEKEIPWIDGFIEAGRAESQYVDIHIRGVNGMGGVTWSRDGWVWLNRSLVDYRETAKRRIGNGSRYEVYMTDGSVIRVTTVPKLKKLVDRVLLADREITDRGVCTLGKEKYQVSDVLCVETRKFEDYVFLRVDVNVNGSVKEFHFIEDGRKFDWTKWLWKKNLSSFAVTEDGTRAVPD